MVAFSKALSEYVMDARKPNKSKDGTTALPALPGFWPGGGDAGKRRMTNPRNALLYRLRTPATAVDKAAQMGWLSKIAEMGDAARESGPVLFEMAKLHHDVALKRAATKALRAVFNIDDVDFDINKYHNYSEFVKTFERQGRLTDAKQQSVPEIASPVETQPHVAALRSRAAALPESYEQRAAALAAESHTFRQELAAQLAPALNAHIQAMPHETLDQKKELARWVNEELERFGLAVQCPKTGLPAKLRGTAGNWPGVGTFCYQIYRNGKPEKSAYSDTLPELTLMDAIPPKESQVTWQQAVGPKESRASRRR